MGSNRSSGLSAFPVYLSGAGLELPQLRYGCAYQEGVHMCLQTHAHTYARGWTWSAEDSVFVYLQQAT